MTIKPWTAGHCYYDGDVVMHEGKRYRQRDGYGGVTPSSVPPGSPEWQVKSCARWVLIDEYPPADWANVPITDKISRLERRVNDLEAGVKPLPDQGLASWGAEWEDSWPKVRAEVRRLENVVKFHQARATYWRVQATHGGPLTGEDE